jgi:hypothetical protein
MESDHIPNLVATAFKGEFMTKKVKLKKGCGSKVRSENIRKLIKSGEDQYTAVGLAIKEQEKCKKKGKK